jgi:sugar diacid utilization regulator
MDRDPGAALIARAARRIGARRSEFVGAMVENFATTIAPLGQDEQMRQLLAASTEANVVAILHVLEHGIDPHVVEPPPAAAQYARRLAQQAVPLSALLRAYRLGHADFVETMLGEISTDPEAEPKAVAAASAAVVRETTVYIDTVSELVVIAYENEREAWARNDSTLRAARIRALLEGEDVEVRSAERALGYTVHQTHVAVLLWFDDHLPRRGDELIRLERLAAAAATLVGGPHLFSARDEGSAVVWFARPGDGPDPTKLVAALTPSEGVVPRLALGRPGSGLSGFRDTHRQAGQAMQVAVAAGPDGPAVTDFAEVGSIALMCHDLGAARIFVQDVLGPLAADDDHAERLRETVRVFLATGSSYTAAAELLRLHKNSVQYRIQKAEQLRGRPFKADRFDVEFALRACHLLGSAVLRGN